MSGRTRGKGADRPVEAVLAAAAGHVAAGRFGTAIRQLEKDGAALRHPTGKNILGNALLRSGKPEAALAAFDAALALAPQFPEAHCNRGVALQDLGRLEEALDALDRAIALRAAYPLAYFNRGNVLKAMGRPGEALEAHDRAAGLEPRFAEAHLNRGFVLLDLDESNAALDAFDAALRLRPGWGEAAVGRAASLGRLHRPAEAVAAIDVALAADPANPDWLAMRGDALTALRRHDEARAAYEAALAGFPETASGFTRRAKVLVDLKRCSEALAAADRAVDLGAGAEGHFARARALRGLDRFAEELAAVDAARQLGKRGSAFEHARAMALIELGRDHEALAGLEAAIAIDPDDAQMRFDMGLLLLHRGDFEQGWKAYEHRLRVPGYAPPLADPETPRWSGGDISGKRVLVHGEQGLGDAIQMLRYLDRVAETGATIGLAVPAALERLAARNFPHVDVVHGDRQPSGFDAQVSLMSLPFIFRTRLDTIPATVPYLAAEDELVAKWRERIGADGFKVGICWSGNPDYGGDRYRSIPLAALAPLGAFPGLRLVSLQAIHGLDQLRELPTGLTVEDLGDDIADNPDGLAEIAGVMASLDLVISADTAVAHLAGALARPVWTAIRFQPEWRWLEGRSDPPWYPTMWLFRQPAIGDWESVFVEMSRYLERFWRESGRPP
jgi:tetratricopeptide (TPR) repeat protein